MVKRKVTANEVVKLMKEEGETLTIEQAEKMLDFMYKMAEITLKRLWLSFNCIAEERIISSIPATR